MQRDLGHACPACDDAAVLEDHDPVGERRGVDRIVGHEEPHARRTRRGGAELAPDLDAGAGVERGERLVEQQQPRLGRERAGERDALGLTAGELAGLRVGVGRRARPARASRRPRARASRLATPRLRRPNATFSSAREEREQQVVLEHHADRPALGRHEDVRRRRRRATIAVEPRRARRRVGASPASARSERRLARAVRSEDRDDLVADASSSTSSSSVPTRGRAVERVEASSARPPEPAVAQRHEHDDRHREQHEAQRDRGLGLASRAARYTASGMVCVRPWMLPANVIVAPNSPSARAHASAAPATSDGARNGSVTRRNVVQRPGAERRGRVLVARVDRAQAAFDRDDEERHRDERLGEDHAGRRERELDAEPVVELLADEAVLRPNAKSSATPPTTGGSTIGSRTSARTSGRPGNVDAGEHPRQRHAEHDRQRASPRASTRATAAARRVRCRSAQVVPERAPRRALAAARRAGSTKNATATRRATSDRTTTTRRTRRRRLARRAATGSGRQGTRTWRGPSARQATRRSRRTPCASLRVAASPASGAIGYIAIAFCASGIVDARHRGAGGLHVGHVDDRGVGVTRRDTAASVALASAPRVMLVSGIVTPARCEDVGRRTCRTGTVGAAQRRRSRRRRGRPASCTCFGLPGFDRDLELVAREDRAATRSPCRPSRACPCSSVGRREHVGRRAALDLGDQRRPTSRS